MSETKRCPYCGEEILAVAKKCKHCGEWLESKEIPKEKTVCPVCGEQIIADAEICPHCRERIASIEPEQEQATIAKDDILYCRHCKNPLSKDASQCIHCGNSDPFFFKALEKEQRDYSFGWKHVVVSVIFTELFFLITGLSNGLLRWKAPQLITCIILCAVFTFCGVFLRKDYRAKHEKEIADVFNELGDKDAFSRWKTKVNQVLDS